MLVFKNAGMKLPTFYFISHGGRAFVYREHYENSAEMNAAAFDVNRITGDYVCPITRRPAPKLVFVKRPGKYPRLHLINQKRAQAFGV